MFKHPFGQAVISTRIGQKHHGLAPKNEFGIVVSPGHPGNGTSMIYFPDRGTRYVSPRYDVRPINLGSKPQMSMAEGRGYLPRLGDDGSWHLVTRGDSNFLARQAAASAEAESVALVTESADSLLSSAFNSSIAADEVFAELSKHHKYVHVPMLEEEFAVTEVTSGKSQVHIVDQSDEEIQANPGTDDVVPSVPNPASPVQGRSRANKGHTNWYKDFAMTAYTALVTFMMAAGAIFVARAVAPDVSMLMANVSVSNEHFMRQNPKWNKAKVGPDKEHWLAADKKEWDQQFDPEHTTLEEVSGGLNGVPKGMPVYPIKRVCRIKSDGTYKLRWCVLGNLDDYGGEVFAPTICKKIVWLIFAVAVLLGLINQFFDIKGAFMSERPSRDIYVTLDGKVYRLLYELYGLKDAARLFNDGLVQHLVAGGYAQSKWDQCFFVKWVSVCSFIYIIFHVDDFKVSATHQHMIDEFGDYLRTKYQTVTTTKDGLFLGIRMEAQSDRSCIFTKPHQLQAIFDKYIPDGPTMSIPQDPMSEKYIKNFDLDDSPPCDISEFKSAMGMLVQHVDYRLDIAFPVSKIGHRASNPRVKDMDALLYIIHYLYGTRDLGLRLRAGDKESAKIVVQLRAYADYSHACHGNGKGQYTVCFDLVDAARQAVVTPMERVYNTGMFYFKSWMAPTVDLSSCEGECGTIVEAVKDSILLQGCLEEMHQHQLAPTPVYNDNQSSITLATQYSGKHKRVRYMLPRINWLMEKTKQGIYNLQYLHTKELPADFGTKRMGGASFTEGRVRAMGLS